MSIYLKRMPNGEVLAMGDEETLQDLGGGTYDLKLSEEDWESCDCIARMDEDGTIVLGLSDAEVYERNANAVRAERKRLLHKCDRMSPMCWNSMSDEKKQAWIDFRQALLDLPQQEGFPWDGDIGKVPWPKKPER